VWAREIKRGRHLWARLQFYIMLVLRFDLLVAEYFIGYCPDITVKYGISSDKDGY
jgi:hypothetical protein